jgi:hypothetical protein
MSAHLFGMFFVKTPTEIVILSGAHRRLIA